MMTTSSSDGHERMNIENVHIRGSRAERPKALTPRMSKFLCQVALVKVFKVSRPPFPHVHDENDNNSTYFVSFMEIK